jgi:hypothetical protein
MSAYLVTMVLALAAVACERGGISISPESSTETASSPTVAPAPISPTTSSTSDVSEAAPGSTGDECTPGQQIAPATLAASWPARLGTRVRLKSRIEVSVDMMDAVVTAAGHRFVVVAGPDQLWQADKDRTFTVMGSRTVSLGGLTTLPQLLLEPECSP